MFGIGKINDNDYVGYIVDKTGPYKRGTDTVKFEVKFDKNLASFIILIRGRDKNFIQIIYDISKKRCIVDSGIASWSGDWGFISSNEYEGKLLITWHLPEDLVLGEHGIILRSILRNGHIVEQEGEITVWKNETSDKKADEEREARMREFDKLKNTKPITTN